MKIVRAVVEVEVPDFVTEKRLVLHLQQILPWPIQLGVTGEKNTRVTVKFKQFSRVYAALRKQEPSPIRFTFREWLRGRPVHERKDNA